MSGGAPGSLDGDHRYGRFNPAGRNANMANEIRFRNAIVTGNAPNGLSFRGDAGYLAADDFSAETGANRL